MNKAKKIYHSSCRNFQNGQKQESEGKEKEISEDIVKKLQDKVEKFSVELNESKRKYEEALRDLTGYAPKYQEDMKYQFNKCQELEEIRKNFFQTLLLHYHEAITQENYMTR